MTDVVYDGVKVWHVSIVVLCLSVPRTVSIRYRVVKRKLIKEDGSWQMAAKVIILCWRKLFRCHSVYDNGNTHVEVYLLTPKLLHLV